MKSTENNNKLSLEMFFSVKTHKVKRPLRVIVSEKGIWQKSLALFLQEKLNMLFNEDPVHNRSPDEVIEFLRRLENKCLK